MRALELPPRLRLIAGWVPEGAYLADVGTDHGYLPTWLGFRERSGEQWPAICGPARWSGPR